MNDAINHPEAAQLVDSLVASGGGLVSYEFGAPGRQIAVAAGAHLAARTGTSLTVIDFRHLLPQIRAIVAELHPDLTCRLMPAGEAVQHPERNTDGVLVVHADLLHDPGTADRLIVASCADVDEPVLNTLAGPRFVVSARALMPPVPANASAPEIRRRFEAFIGTPYSDRFTERRERQERFVRQLKQGDPGEHDRVGVEEFTEAFSFEELTRAVQNADPDELRRRIARVQEQQGQRTAGYPAPGSPQQVTRDHGQEQSAAHQQQGPQGIGLT
ncbi:hypothetical protein V7793_18255 [Streptomyces sp. KLMMK]|uniref:hypothetical protein n=1 Tax=Streptomyces sp. KLMMK TaxID=3109353 RepID=UPI00300B0E84